MSYIDKLDKKLKAEKVTKKAKGKTKGTKTKGKGKTKITKIEESENESDKEKEIESENENGNEKVTRRGRKRKSSMIIDDPSTPNKKEKAESDREVIFWFFWFFWFIRPDTDVLKISCTYLLFFLSF